MRTSTGLVAAAVVGGVVFTVLLMCGGLAIVASLSPTAATRTNAIGHTGKATQAGTPTAGAPVELPATVASPSATTAVPSLAPIGSPSPAPAHTTATSRTTTGAPHPTHVPPSLCGAPPNPWGFNFCGRGPLIYAANLPSGVCSYFACIANFSKGLGYMEECADGRYSMSGGRQGACSYHGGELQPVYRG